MGEIKLEKSRANLFLIEGNKDNIAFQCFADATKEHGGYIISWQTPEMLNERYGLTVELANLRPSNAIPKSNVINYLSLDDTAAEGAVLERIVRKCRNSLEAKMPFMFDGIEQLMLEHEPKSMSYFLHELVKNATKVKVPILILINKNKYNELSKAYRKELEDNVDRYVVKHDIN